MRALVLGAGGFIGGHLVSALLSADHNVIAYGRPGGLEKFKSLGSGVEVVEGDFCKEERWAEILIGVHICYHLISTTTPKSSNDAPSLDVMENIVGTLGLLDVARRHNVRIIFASSGGTVYGTIQSDTIDEEHPTNPLCSYGISKLAIEKYLYLYQELYGLRAIVLRIANPYGEGQRPDSAQGAVAVFMGRILRGYVIDIWGDGSVVRDYIYIKDVVDVMLAASSYGGKLSVFNVGSGIGVSLLNIVQMIEEVTGVSADIVFHPPRGFDVPKNVLNISKVREGFGWTSKTSMIEGLKRTEKWMLEAFF